MLKLKAVTHLGILQAKMSFSSKQEEGWFLLVVVVLLLLLLLLFLLLFCWYWFLLLFGCFCSFSNSPLTNVVVDNSSASISSCRTANKSHAENCSKTVDGQNVRMEE